MRIGGREFNPAMIARIQSEIDSNPALGAESAPNPDTHNLKLERTQETMAMLKILALGNRQIEDGRVQPVADVIARVRRGKG